MSNLEKRKTVADAYEKLNEKQPLFDTWTHIRFSPASGLISYAYGDESLDSQIGIVVCTREEFEAYAREQKKEPRKTIQDVLEAFPDDWPDKLNPIKGDGWDFNERNEIVWTVCSKDGGMRAFFDSFSREEYEKARAEKLKQEGKKWTHEFHELKCRFLIDKPDREGYKVIVNELNEYYCVNEEEELTPIKPKLTKAEAWDMVDNGESVKEVRDKYEIID